MDISDQKIDEQLSAEFVQLTEKEHGIEKSMHLGSHKVSTYDIYTYRDGVIALEPVKYSQVFYKMFDEILVNAMDVKMKFNTIKTIEITFDKATGEISIHNDGSRGIPCGIVKTSNGTPIYLPEMLYTHFRSGSNHKKCKKTTENTDHISTGTNGLGCKLVTVNATYVSIETHDIERKIHYTQIIENQMDVIHPPTIEKLKRGHNGTTIKYIASWSLFTGWGKKFTPAIFKTMDEIFHARVIFASAYLGIPITYNGHNINVTNALQLSHYFIMDPISTTIKPKEKPVDTFRIYPWDICVGIQSNPVQLSVVNGACVSAGQHIEHIINQIVAKIKPLIERMFKKSKGIKYQKRMVTNYLSLVFVGIIPNIEFDSQLKTKLVCPDEFVAHYVVPPKMIKTIWTRLEPILFEQYMVVAEKKTKRRTLVTRNKDYEPAKFAGRLDKDTYLLVIEGHSAASMVRRCLVSSEVKDLSFQNCGLYCLGGVTSNVQNEIEVTTDANGKRKVTISKKLRDAPKFNAFLKINNLDLAKDYMDPEDLKTLVYKYIMLISDADVDGIGNICGNLLSNFQVLWPGLYYHGVIFRLSTPVQRWYPTSSKESIINFYTDADARTWAEANTTAKGKLKYFKGLATHSDEDAVDIFQSFFKLITKYKTTEHSTEIAKHMFGPDATMRKIYHSNEANMNDARLNNLYTQMARPGQTPLELAIQTYVKDEPKYSKTGIEKVMTVEQHMLTYSMEYQYANNDRSIPHYIDGLLRTHRKCIFAGMKRKGEIKIFQMGGHVALEMAYHHGSDSIEGVLIKLAQCYPGANNVPLFLPIGQFGSRARGGKDCGSSRYISTDINPIAYKLFREEDEYILSYTPEDGVLVEPDYLCPVFPHICSIHHDNIGHAWYCSAFARDHDSLMVNVINMIDGNKPTSMPPGLCNWHGVIVNIDGVEYSLGTYTYDEDNEIVHITELPFQVWNDTYLYSEKSGIAYKEYVKDVDDQSTDIAIDIKIHMKPNTMDDIMNKYSGRMFDPIIECFKLKVKMNTFLNFIGPNYTMHFTSYQNMLIPWFNERKRLYDIRIRRQAVIIKLKIQYYENLIRFIDNYDTLNVATGKDEDEADAFLAEHKFDRFDKTLMDNPKFTPVDKIITLATSRPGASYEYIKSAHHPNKRTPKACLSNRNELDKLKQLLDDIADPSYATRTWLSELFEYDAAYKKGITEGWVKKTARRRK